MYTKESKTETEKIWLMFHKNSIIRVIWISLTRKKFREISFYHHWLKMISMFSMYLLSNGMENLRIY